MKSAFFITAILINIETETLEPKYRQDIFFNDRITCEDYVAKNWTILHDGLQYYLDMKGQSENLKIQSMGCSEMNEEDLEKIMEKQIDKTGISA
tara:strand:+ start:1518 stop:1799 length:282 start_codon:yes stop_codon:yes gene_type:complete